MTTFQGKIPFYLPAEKSLTINIKIQESKSSNSEMGSKMRFLVYQSTFQTSIKYVYYEISFFFLSYGLFVNSFKTS